MRTDVYIFLVKEYKSLYIYEFLGFDGGQMRTNTDRALARRQFARNVVWGTVGNLSIAALRWPILFRTQLISLSAVGLCFFL